MKFTIFLCRYAGVGQMNNTIWIYWFVIGCLLVKCNIAKINKPGVEFKTKTMTNILFQNSVAIYSDYFFEKQLFSDKRHMMIHFYKTGFNNQDCKIKEWLK